MLELKAFEPLIRPLSTCPKCSSTDAEPEGFNNHLQMPLTCKTCGTKRVALVMIAQEGEAEPCPEAPGADPTSE